MLNMVRRYVIPATLFAGMLLVTFTCAPNYRWQESFLSDPYGADFLQEWVGGRMVLMGHARDVYDFESFRAWQHDRALIGFDWDEQRYYPPVYPPLHYAVFAILAWIPYRWCAMLWVAFLWGLVFLNAIWIAAIARHETRGADPRASHWQNTSFFGWFAILLFPVVPLSVMLGQKSLIWLAILCGMVRLLQTERPTKAGIVFALLSLKPTLFFLLPLVMARRGSWRFVGGCVAGMTCMWGLSLLLLPWSMWQGYLATLSQAVQYGTQGGYRPDWSCSVWSIAKAWPADWRIWVAGLVCTPLAGYVVLGLFRRGGASLDPRTLFLTLAATMLLSPHAYHYDLCILLLPVGWMVGLRPRFAIATYTALAFGLASSSMFYAVVPIPLLVILLWCCAAAWIAGPDSWRARVDKEPAPSLDIAMS